MISAARADPCPLSITGQRTGRKKGGNMDQYASIPAELKSMDQWVGFVLDYNEEKGKNDKLPIDPHKLTNAKANDPGTWGMYQSAFDCIGKKASYWVQRKSGWQKHEKTIDGIGFEFAGGIFGVDLDHVITQDGVDAAAQDIIETLDSYTEYSPSGAGVHILCKGTIPTGERKAGSAEMYSQGRFFTVTGKAFGPVKQLAERTAQAAAVHAKYFKKGDQDQGEQDPPAGQQAAPSPVVAVGQPLDWDAAINQRGQGRADDEVLQRAFNSRNGERIRALYAGDITAHNGADRSHSAADLALCSELAYWTNGDAAQIDRMFRQSRLTRPKWDEVHKRDDNGNAFTYGQLTIAAALKDFQPYIPRSGSTAEQDFAPVGSDGPPAGGPDELETDPRPDAAGHYLTDHFLDDIARFIKYKDRKTGFSNLDEKTSGLYPGLYVIGAVPSLGKTTFVHQLGDQLAEAGDHVLYFSLEQSRLEMITKSLSRITAKQDRLTAISAINIRRGQITQAVNDALKEYRTIADRSSIIALNFDASITYIQDYIQEYIKRNDTKPIVIIDYLQIIPPADPRQSNKDKIDEIVRALKKLQGNNDLVVFIISSFNRTNYLAPVDYESFKESGGIEYTADVVWGLQLQIQNSELFNSEKKIKEKREAIRAAKEANPRKVELVCLKNRYGISNYSCGFNYDPVHDLFQPDLSYPGGNGNSQPQKRL